MERKMRVSRLRRICFQPLGFGSIVTLRCRVDGDDRTEVVEHQKKRESDLISDSTHRESKERELATGDPPEGCRVSLESRSGTGFIGTHAHGIQQGHYRSSPRRRLEHLFFYLFHPSQPYSKHRCKRANRRRNVTSIARSARKVADLLLFKVSLVNQCFDRKVVPADWVQTCVVSQNKLLYKRFPRRE